MSWLKLDVYRKRNNGVNKGISTQVLANTPLPILTVDAARDRRRQVTGGAQELLQDNN